MLCVNQCVCILPLLEHALYLHHSPQQPSPSSSFCHYFIIVIIVTINSKKDFFKIYERKKDKYISLKAEQICQNIHLVDFSPLMPEIWPWMPVLQQVILLLYAVQYCIPRFSQPLSVLPHMLFDVAFPKN